MSKVYIHCARENDANISYIKRKLKWKVPEFHNFTNTNVKLIAFITFKKLCYFVANTSDQQDRSSGILDAIDSNTRRA